MIDNYLLNDGFIDVVGYLDNTVNIKNVSKNSTFLSLARKEKTFVKMLDKKYISSLDNLIEYVKNSTILKKVDEVKKGTIFKMVEELYIAKIANLKGCQNKNNELKEFFNFNTFTDVHLQIVEDLQNIKRDVETNAPIRANLLELIQKYTLILGYKVAFTTSRKRFTEARNFVKSAEIEADIKDLFISRFNFSSSIAGKIANRTDTNTFLKISNKIEVNKKNFDNSFKELSSEIDALNIKLDGNNNVISAKNVEIKRAITGKLLKVEFAEDKKIETFTRLAIFVVLGTGRRLSELLVKPSNIGARIENSKKDIEGFSDIVDLKYKEIFLKIKDSTDTAIFLNQKKKNKGADNVKGFMIPVGNYEKTIRALLLLRVFIPNIALKKGEAYVADYMRSYINKEYLKNNFEGIKDLKDCRSLYVTIAENKYNRGNTDFLVYMQNILGHEKGLNDLKTTLHYNRFKLV